MTSNNLYQGKGWHTLGSWRSTLVVESSKGADSFSRLPKLPTLRSSSEAAGWQVLCLRCCCPRPPYYATLWFTALHTCKSTIVLLSCRYEPLLLFHSSPWVKMSLPVASISTHPSCKYLLLATHYDRCAGAAAPTALQSPCTPCHTNCRAAVFLPPCSLLSLRTLRLLFQPVCAGVVVG